MSVRPSVSTQSVAVDRRTMLRIALLGGVAAAATGFAVTAHAADAAAEPIQSLGSSLVQLTQNGRAPFAQRFAQLAPVVDQTFDLSAILRTSVGPRWDTLSPADQAELMRVFRQYTVASFVANFDKPKGTFQLIGARDTAGGQKVVDSTIGDTRLSYVMRQTPSGWRVVDVLADGTISRVATQRSDFHSTLASGGGPALVAVLQRKVSDLSGGSVA
jgi:phospholipid transport system substrate-binding protein